MKKISYIAFFILTLIGCNNSENKGDINECISLFRTAESCKQIEKELPCGLRFGMNLKEMRAHLEKLASKGKEIKKKGDHYIYLFKADNNLYECNIMGRPSSQNPFDTIAPINEFCFIFDNSLVKFKGEKETLFRDMENEFKGWNSALCQFEYTRTEKRNKMWHDYNFTKDVYCWASQNLAVILTDYNVLSITFYNAPITKPTGELRHIAEEIKEIGENEKKGKIVRHREKKFKEKFDIH